MKARLSSKQFKIIAILLVLFIASWGFQCGLSLTCVTGESTFANSDFLVGLRENLRIQTLRYLPSPHSELLLGLTVGLDELHKVSRFKENLVATGTIHVVVVSGYNISLVFNTLYLLIGKPYDKSRLSLGIIVTFMYSMFSGFEPPIIRAWTMGGILLLGKYYGKQISALYVLLVSAFFILIWSPAILLSLSFQLSFLATLSLILFSEPITLILDRLLNIQSVIKEDFVATVSAQILVWPLISYKFGTFSLISPFVNALILWTIPIATIMGSVFLSLIFVSNVAAKLFVFLLYVPLDLFVIAINIASKLHWATIQLQISSKLFIAYYIAIFLLFIYKNRKDNVSRSY